jgi:DNA integrity scanning protein DisA with diadenylate cyclase activity
MNGMAEIRFETDAQDVAVLDGYCHATGQCRTEVLKSILSDWSEKKLHESILIVRVAGVNPTEPDTKGKA